MSSAIPLPSPLIDTLNSFVSSEQQSASEFAKIDLQSVKDFLKQYDGNPATFDAYRREVERLIQWTWLILTSSPA